MIPEDKHVPEAMKSMGDYIERMGVSSIEEAEEALKCLATGCAHQLVQIVGTVQTVAFLTELMKVAIERYQAISHEELH